MKIRYRKIDKDIHSPEYKTHGAAGMDLYSRETVTIDPGKLGYIPINIAIEVPEGYFAALVDRSSSHKLGVAMINSFGVLDSDFNGDNDEAMYIAYNFTDKPVTIERGTRFAQIVIMKHAVVELEEVDSLGNEDRGGIGSTGNK